MNLTINHKNKKINVQVEECGFFGRFRGLMFRHREKALALLFDFKKPRRLKIHSWFVFFPFVAVWLDDKDKIIEIKRVKPWKFCVLPKQKFWKLIEIPCNKRYNSLLGFLVDK